MYPTLFRNPYKPGLNKYNTNTHTQEEWKPLNLIFFYNVEFFRTNTVAKLCTHYGNSFYFALPNINMDILYDVYLSFYSPYPHEG